MTKLEKLFNFDFEEPGKIKEKIQKRLKSLDDIKTLDDLLDFIPKPVEFIEVSLIFEGVKEDLNPHFGTLETETLFKVFKAKISIGSDPIFLIVEPNVFLTADSRVLLKPIEDDSLIEQMLKNFPKFEKILKKEAKKLGYDKNANVVKIFKFYTIENELPEELLKLLATNKKLIQELYERILPKDLIDERIYYLNLMRFFNFADKPVSKYQRFQPHALVIANTKIGKTTIPLLFFGSECVYDSGKSARFLGYSTADQVFPGELHNRTLPVFLDDMNIGRWEKSFLDQIPNALENGVIAVAKGAKTIRSKLLCAFTFSTNTKYLDSGPLELVKDFDVFLTNFSETSQRIGSRIGVVFFGTDFKTINGTIEVNDKIIWLFKQIGLRTSQIISKLLNKKQFLNLLEKRNEGYEKMVIHSLQTFVQLKNIVSFWLAHLEGFRHINGGAFLLAMMEYIRDYPEVLITESVDFQIFQEYFNRWLLKIYDWNIRSLQNMSMIIPDSYTYLKFKYECITSTYTRILFLSISHYFLTNYERIQENVLYPLDLLKDSFDIAVKCLALHLEDTRYYAFSRLVEKLTPSAIEALNTIFTDYGIALYRLTTTKKEELFFSFTKKDVLYEFLKRFASDLGLEYYIHTHPLGEIGEAGETNNALKNESQPQKNPNLSDFKPKEAEKNESENFPQFPQFPQGYVNIQSSGPDLRIELPSLKSDNEVEKNHKKSEKNKSLESTFLEKVLYAIKLNFKYGVRDFEEMIKEVSIFTALPISETKKIFEKLREQGYITLGPNNEIINVYDENEQA